MTPRLVPWPRAALAVLVVAAAIVAGLGLLVHDDTTGNRLDNWLEGLISRHIADSVLRQALHLTDPPLVVGLLVSVVIVAALVQRWDVALLAAVAPALATILTEVVLKPLVHRSTGAVTDGLGQAESFVYPSGHETGIASLVAVLGLVLLGSGVRRTRKIAGIVVLAAVAVAAAVGLVGLFYHYATDTVGAFGVAVATTLAVGLAIDQASAMLSSRLREPVPEPR